MNTADVLIIKSKWFKSATTTSNRGGHASHLSQRFVTARKIFSADVDVYAGGGVFLELRSSHFTAYHKYIL
jgi:hypothetical protein